MVRKKCQWRICPERFYRRRKIICRNWRLRKVRKHSVRALVIWLRRYDFIRYSSLRISPRIARKSPRAIPIHHGRRVPGHKLSAITIAVQFDQRERRQPKHHGGWRRRPSNLQLPRRRRGQYPAFPPALSRPKNHRFDRQLSFRRKHFIIGAGRHHPRRGSTGKHNWRAIKAIDRPRK